ncbi:hypothetical protein PM082_012481 [Marasmius tenuissimus]|nr:hypothetical protein PM082_012481 [Marasmius tenuissimus]
MIVTGYVPPHRREKSDYRTKFVAGLCPATSSPIPTTESAAHGYYPIMQPKTSQIVNTQNSHKPSTLRNISFWRSRF